MHADPTMLARLVSPISASEFLTRYWRRESLYVPATTDRLSVLAFYSERYAAIRSTLDESPRDVHARFVDPAGMQRAFSFRSNYIDSILAAGITVCVAGIDTDVPALTEQCRDLERSLDSYGHVYVNCYISPPHGGFGTHFDTTDVFTIHLQGEKTWWYGPGPALAHPPAPVADARREDWQRLHAVSPHAVVEAPETTAFVEQTLRPGDMLYLPAGTWHRTTSASGSVSLAMSVSHVDLATVIANLVHRELLRDSTWRGVLPPAASDLERGTKLAAILSEAAARISKLPPERLRDAVDIAVRATPMESAPVDPIEIRTDDCFQRIPGFSYSLATGDGGEPILAVSCGEVRLTMSIDNKRFFERLSATPQFTAEDAMGWDDEPLAWEDVATVLSTLLASGIIYRTRRTPHTPPTRHARPVRHVDG